MKKILLLGSTGSIGISTLDIVRAFPDQFSVYGLTANTNIELLIQQVNQFKPRTVVIRSKEKVDELKNAVGNKCEVLSGDEGLIEISKRGDYDVMVSAIVGFAGLNPTIEAIKQKKRIALANKETLVVAGELIIDLCEQYNVELIPVDSEHSAIFQCLNGENKNEIKKIILTASGGPFLNKSKSELKHVTIEVALNHPNWKMGNKITIDSATMMNKGLEVIEAYWLFRLPKEKIEVIIHPQSIIHSMVEFIDGSIKAQISTPDMKLPILYALSYPQRYSYHGVRTDFKLLNQLTFFEPDFDKFTCLKLAYEAIDEGGVAPSILSAANEIAVEYFLKGKIEFSQIPEIIRYALDNIFNHQKATLETILESDFRTRELIKEKFN